MTLRERIADWISGGALTRMYRTNKETFEAGNGWREWAQSHKLVSEQLQSRLNRIAAQETPGANATVRRMARIARGEE